MKNVSKTKENTTLSICLLLKFRLRNPDSCKASGSGNFPPITKN